MICRMYTVASPAGNFEGQHSLLQLQRMWRGLIAFCRSRPILGLGVGLLPLAPALRVGGVLTSRGVGRDGAGAGFFCAMGFLAPTTFSPQVKGSRRLALS